MGILIPLYTYPTSQTWYDVIKEKLVNIKASITVVVNPNNGVGVGADANYIFGIRNLQLNGVTVLGYVATSYGNRAMDSIQAECVRYAAWYSVDGIFFDEYQSGWLAPTVPGISLGNPGTEASGNIPLVTYERAGMPPPGFSGNYIAHTVGTLPTSYAKPPYYYITDDPATYQRLPSYFAELVRGDASGPAPVTPPPVGPSRTMSLTTPDGAVYTWTVLP